MTTFTTIRGVSERRRLPRLGKIRLGVKETNSRGVTYPREVDYFVVPQEVAGVYGNHPKELDIMFPVDDAEVIFPQRLVAFGQSRGPMCMGNGEEARRVREDGSWEDIECSGERCDLYRKKSCSRRAHLMFLLPSVSIGGIWQLDVSSYHSIVDVNSGLDYCRALTGRIAMVPLRLCRVPRETHGSGRRETHYPLQLRLNADVSLLNALRADRSALPPLSLPAPSVENPEMDEPAQDGAGREVECPEIGAAVTVEACANCKQRDGCPSW